MFIIVGLLRIGCESVGTEKDVVGSESLYILSAHISSKLYILGMLVVVLN